MRLPSLFIALDGFDGDQARRVATNLVETLEQGDPAIGLKVGLELLYREGPAIIGQLSKLAPVFVDAKLHDIPQTVAQATTALVTQGARILNVHASGGPDMLKATVEAAKAATDEPVTLLAVTILTSLESHTLKTLWKTGAALPDLALTLARASQEAGLDGVVCSAHEASDIRSDCGSGFACVTPGIRPAGVSTDDQRRVVTPTQAFRLGATSIVVGRPITQAQNPRQVLRDLLDELHRPHAVDELLSSVRAPRQTKQPATR